MVRDLMKISSRGTRQGVIFQGAIGVAENLHRFGEEAIGKMTLHTTSGNHGSTCPSLDSSRSRRKRTWFSSLMASRLCLHWR